MERLISSHPNIPALTKKNLQKKNQSSYEAKDVFYDDVTNLHGLIFVIKFRSGKTIICKRGRKKRSLVDLSVWYPESF